MKKRIDIHGMSTTAAHRDGDCRSVLNLRKKNGVLRPVTPRKKVRTLAHTYDYLFQHNLPQTGENLLGVRNNKLYWVKPDDSEVELATVSNFKNMTQIGNIVNLLDGSGMRHVWWVDGEYKVFNSSFEALQDAEIVGPIKVDLKVDGRREVSQDGLSTKDVLKLFYSETKYKYSSFTESKTPENIKQRVDATLALSAKALSVEAERGFLHGFCFAVPVLQLFDGTYVHLSNPVLLGQAYDSHTRYSGLTVDGTTLDYATRKGVWYGDYDSNAVDIDNTVELLRSEVILYRNAGTMSQYLDTPIFPSLIASYTYRDHNEDRFGLNPIVVAIKTNVLKFKLGSYIPDHYKTLVKSVSIFLTNEVQMYDLTKGQYNSDMYVGDSGGFKKYYQNLSARVKTNAEIHKELADNQQFYKVHEIPFSELQNITVETWVTIDLKGKIGENLKYQDELPVGNHHNTIPYNQIAYNSKLHAIGYKSEIVRPWPVDYFLTHNGIGQFGSTSLTTGYFNYSKVYIKTETGTTEVVRYKPYTGSQAKSTTHCMLSYPDSRAYKMELYLYNIVGTNYGYHSKETYTLTPSETHNFAYYIPPDLKPISRTWVEGNGGSTAIPAEANRTLYYRNAIKVSLVHNPFYYDPATTMNVGTGNILTAGANAMQMSEGQFGQYDLYVLTDEGIYSLDTGTTINYNRISPASLEIPTSDIICPTPHGLVFIGRRGAYIMNGPNVSMVSTTIEEDTPASSIDTNDYSFLTFLEGLKDILYNPFEREIIFVGQTYNYVLHVESKEWYMSNEAISIEIKNSQPQLLVANGPEIKSYAASESNKAKVAFVTRPIYFGVDETKKLQRCVVRGLFKYLYTNPMQAPQQPFLAIFGSRDSVEHKLLRGWLIPSNLQNRDYKDFDSGMMPKTSYRNYSISFAAEIDERSKVEYIDCEVSDPLNNDKMR